MLSLWVRVVFTNLWEIFHLSVSYDKWLNVEGRVAWEMKGSSIFQGSCVSEFYMKFWSQYWNLSFFTIIFHQNYEICVNMGWHFVNLLQIWVFMMAFQISGDPTAIICSEPCSSVSILWHIVASNDGKYTSTHKSSSYSNVIWCHISQSKSGWWHQCVNSTNVEIFQ